MMKSIYAGIILLISCSLGAMEDISQNLTSSEKEELITLKFIGDFQTPVMHIPKKYIDLCKNIAPLVNTSCFEEYTTKTIELSLVSKEDFERVYKFLHYIDKISKKDVDIQDPDNYFCKYTDNICKYEDKAVGSILQAVKFLGVNRLHDDIVETIASLLISDSTMLIDYRRKYLDQEQSIEESYGITDPDIIESILHKCLENFKKIYNNKLLAIHGIRQQFQQEYAKVSIAVQHEITRRFIEIYFRPENIKQLLAIHHILDAYKRYNPTFKNIGRPFTVSSNSSVAKAFKYLNQDQYDFLANLVHFRSCILV